MVASNYNGPKYVAEAFLKLGMDRHLKILDFLAGTGLVSELVNTFILFSTIYNNFQVM